jgi:hypothetical protein
MRIDSARDAPSFVELSKYLQEACVRKLFTGVAAAVVAGVVLGAVARVLMRVVSMAAGQPGDFSLAGTLAIVALFVAAALPGAILAACWPGRGRWLLLVAGSLVLCVATAGVALTDLQSFGGLTSAQWVGAGAATVAILVTVLALPVVTLRMIGLIAGRRHAPRPSDAPEVLAPR